MYVSCSVPHHQPRHWNCLFWDSPCGVEWTCWPTGSWRYCLSLNDVRSVQIWYTTISRLVVSWASKVIQLICVYIYYHTWCKTCTTFSNCVVGCFLYFHQSTTNMTIQCCVICKLSHRKDQNQAVFVQTSRLRQKRINSKQYTFITTIQTMIMGNIASHGGLIYTQAISWNTWGPFYYMV